MTTEFKLATKELYTVFAKYPVQSKIEGCPCCVSDTDKATLHAKPLRALEDENLFRYTFKAMTTWGSVNDFKHYLPRIFELAASRKLIVDTFVILGKLDYGQWTSWDAKEVSTIKQFLKSWWKYDINTHTCFDQETLVELNKFVRDLPGMLADWDVSIENQGFRTMSIWLRTTITNSKERAEPSRL